MTNKIDTNVDRVKIYNPGIKIIPKKSLPILPFNIIGTNHYIPEAVRGNRYFSEKFNVSESWIKKVTGIEERHIVDSADACSDLAAKAASQMLDDTQQSVDDIDVIIFSSMCGDFTAPPTSCIVQKKIGAFNAKAFDITGSCTSYLQSLHVAAMYLNTQQAQKILLVSGDVATRGCNPDDKDTAILLGDGGACTLIEASPDNTSGIVSVDFGTDGRYWDVATIIGGGSEHPTLNSENEDYYWFNMKGKKLFKIALEKLSHSIDQTLENAGLTLDDIQCIIPHQANYRILLSLLKRKNISSDKVHLTIERYGNTATSSIPITLSQAMDCGKINKGDYVMLTGFGAGFSWGNIIIKC